MAFQVTVQPSGKTFEVAEGQSVLEAALAQDVILPYGCRDGACGSCKSLITAGQIEQGPHSAGALKPAEAEQGYALLCCAQALDDLVVEARVIEGLSGIPVRKMPCRVSTLEMAAPDVAVLRLQLRARGQCGTIL